MLIYLVPKNLNHIPFYHIGNVADNRKIFKGMAQPLLGVSKTRNTKCPVNRKGISCNQDQSKIPLPGVKVINGLVSDDAMEEIAIQSQIVM